MHKVNDVTIVPINVAIHDQSLKGYDPQMRLEMRVEHETMKKNKFFLLGNYPNRGGTGGVDFNYPMAIGAYTYALEMDSTDNVLLVIDSLNFGQEFYLEPRAKAEIGDFQLNFSSLVVATLIPDSKGRGGGSESYLHFSLSDGISTKSFSINGHENKGEAQIDTWNNYRISVLDYHDGLECVRLKVEKITEEVKE